MADSGSAGGRAAAPAGGRRAAGRRVLVASGLALSMALLVGITWSVPVARIWRALVGIETWALPAAMLVVSTSFWLRGWRWALFFRTDYRVGIGATTALAAIGLALNAVLPGKAGEVARVALASRRFGCRWPFAAATVVGERLLDGVTLLLFLGVALLGAPSPAAASSASLFGYSVDSADLAGLVRKLAVFCLVLCALIASLISAGSRRLWLRLLAPIPGIGRRAARPLEEIGRGLRAFRSPKVVLTALLHSVLIWLSLALATLVLAAGTPGIELDLRQAVGLTAISIAASALPSAPGAWGVFEAASLLGLTLLAVRFDQGTAIAFVLLMHLSQYLPVLLFGAGSAVASHLSPSDMRSLTERGPRPTGRP